MSRWSTIELEGRKAWMGQTDGISLVVIPELGSKAISHFAEEQKDGARMAVAKRQAVGERRLRLTILGRG